MKTTHRQKDVHWISNNDLVVFAAGDKIEGHNSVDFGNSNRDKQHGQRVHFRSCLGKLSWNVHLLLNTSQTCWLETPWGSFFTLENILKHREFTSKTDYTDLPTFLNSPPPPPKNGATSNKHVFYWNPLLGSWTGLNCSHMSSFITVLILLWVTVWPLRDIQRCWTPSGKKWTPFSFSLLLLFWKNANTFLLQNKSTS